MTNANHHFGRERRLRKKADFQAVFDRKRRAFLGPLGVYVWPNDLGFARLGVTISRKIGSAAKRNRIKRMLRESFRLQAWDALDIVVVPKPHDPLPLQQYIQTLRQAVESATRGKKP